MILKRYGILMGLFFVANLACGDLGQSREERTDEATDELNRLHLEVAQRWCDCFSDEDRYSRCVDEQYQRFDFNACQHSVVACLVDDYEEHLDCERDAVRDFRYCLSECSSAPRNCIDDYRRAQAYCVDTISEDLRSALVSCDLGAPMSCW